MSDDLSQFERLLDTRVMVRSLSGDGDREALFIGVQRDATNRPICYVRYTGSARVEHVHRSRIRVPTAASPSEDAARLADALGKLYSEALCMDDPWCAKARSFRNLALAALNQARDFALLAALEERTARDHDD